MSLSQFLLEASEWLAWAGLALGLATIISFFANWGLKFRLVGATIFSLLVSVSCWAFTQSYMPTLSIDGAEYAPVVYDNGYDLVVAQVSDDFPDKAIEPSLQQIAGNLKGGGRNGARVHVRIRRIKHLNEGLSQPIVLGEVIRDLSSNETFPMTRPEIFQPLEITQSNNEVEQSTDELELFTNEVEQSIDGSEGTSSELS